VDVRLICASNQDLKELVRQKAFRSDLYYRLHVIPVHIPPLRERVEDIPHLITLFLNRFNNKYSKKKVFSSEAIDKLIKYSWPGNVRELANLIERLVVITLGNHIDINDLPVEIYKVPEQDTICQGKNTERTFAVYGDICHPRCHRQIWQCKESGTTPRGGSFDPDTQTQEMQ